MPNHTSQLLTINGDSKETKRLSKLVKSKDSDFDHKKFFPMPKELIGTTSPANVILDKDFPAALAKYKEEKKGFTFETGRPISETESKKLIKKYGCNNWYDWANKNWGTKWGIYEAQGEFGMYSFNSAWSPADKIIQKLSELFPTLDFILEAADEGGGFVCRYSIHNGGCHCADFEWDSDEGIEIRRNVGSYCEEDEG